MSGGRGRKMREVWRARRVTGCGRRRHRRRRSLGNRGRLLRVGCGRRRCGLRGLLGRRGRGTAAAGCRCQLGKIRWGRTMPGHWRSLLCRRHMRGLRVGCCSIRCRSGCCRPYGSCSGRSYLRWPDADRCLLQGLWSNRKCCRRHRGGSGHHPHRHHCRRAAIYELLACHLRRRVGRALRGHNLRDVGDLGCADIGDVDVLDVSRVAGIARPIDFTRCKWEPADRRSDVGRCRCHYAGCGDKGDKRRRIDRLRDEIAGHPAPAVVDPAQRP